MKYARFCMESESLWLRLFRLYGGNFQRREKSCSLCQVKAVGNALFNVHRQCYQLFANFIVLDSDLQNTKDGLLELKKILILRSLIDASVSW